MIKKSNIKSFSDRINDPFDGKFQTKFSWGAVIGAAGAVASPLISKALGSGGSSSNRNIGPISAEEMSLIQELMRGNPLTTPVRQVINPNEIDRKAIMQKANELAAEDFGRDVNIYSGPINLKLKKSYEDRAREAIVNERQQPLDLQYAQQVESYKAARGQLEDQLGADKQLQDLFKNKITSYLSRTQGGEVDQDAFRAAQDFVDKTFTNPAEEQIKKGQSMFETALGARQAALGRGGSDSVFQKQLYQNLSGQQADLGAKRGALISDYYINQPLREIGVATSGLNAVGAMQQQNAFVPTYINQLQQQADQNRANLLNILTGARGGNVTTTTAGPDIGALGRAAQGFQLGQGLGDLFSRSFTNTGTSSEYTPSNSGSYVGAGSNKYGFGL